jgi:hypothetical protein
LVVEEDPGVYLVLWAESSINVDQSQIPLSTYINDEQMGVNTFKINPSCIFNTGFYIAAHSSFR